MSTRRHATKQQTGPHTKRHQRSYHPPAGSHVEAKMNSYIPVFIFIGLFAFVALTMVLKFYNQ